MEIEELTADDQAEAVRLWTEAGLTRPWNDPDDDFRRAASGANSTLTT